ncbi:helix-turn-helix domain-containing protein [Rhizobium tumorigenes]|uniref:helix-turn-helix domain-containing protein n=1 Tax=Rhizobium tumorigenes TaxID=2041385 RepID=UPI00241ED36B|nr:helix-turn-helix domain-containing protein [Rhizobium tumorigenes]WFS02747.1 helix-turn-helix domain-containing protein [Rhizobium tumorigenes]
MAELERLLTVRQAAELLAISVSTMRELVRVGEIAYIQKGRGTERKHMSFQPRDLEDFIKRSRTRESYSPGPQTVRAAMAVNSISFAEASQLRIKERRERKERELRDRQAAAASQSLFKEMLAEKKMKDAERSARIAANKAKREAHAAAVAERKAER